MTSQALYWLLTIKDDAWTRPHELPGNVVYLRGQSEIGTGGYKHWQLLAIYRKKVRLATLKTDFGPTVHAEPSRSNAADAYVWKDDTAVAGTRFELGRRAMRRNSPTDWALVRKSAQDGDFDNVPDDILVRYYGNLQRICKDNLRPIGQERTCSVYWGSTGIGKTRRAFDEAGSDCYFKMPTTKWWDGYRGQEHVIIDEFRGLIDVSHLLRWLDRYPVQVEIKGGSVPLCAKRFWITSNISPDTWYPLLDNDTFGALKRRLGEITHFGSL